MNFSVKMPRCNLCGYTCGDNFNMDRHLKSLYGNQKFPCNFCGSEFNRKDSLKEHIQLKHGALGPKLFQCLQCDYQATQKCALLRHVKTAHGTQKFPCDYCDKVFGRKDKLNVHIKKNHTKRKANEDNSEPAKRPRLLYGKIECDVEF